MKKIFILFFILFSSKTFAQFKDLIITAPNDSVFCDIQQVTDSLIHFEINTKNGVQKTFIESR